MVHTGAMLGDAATELPRGPAGKTLPPLPVRR
jgi:hypothetical protein